MPQMFTDYLFKKIVEVPAEQCTEMYLHFLKDFTIKVFEAQSAAGQGIHAPENHINVQSVLDDLGPGLQDPDSILKEGDHTYGLPQLWNLIQDDFTSECELKGSELLDLSL